jgi:DnaJ-class molecular chaperone
MFDGGAIQMKCAECMGSGKDDGDKCLRCNGLGMDAKSKIIKR